MIWGLLATATAATLSGTVTDGRGDPVDNAYVIVYDSRFQFEFAQTGEDGRFEVTDLPADRYRIRVLPPSSSDASETWAGGTLGACNAAPTVIAEDDDVVIDVPLMTGAQISGRVLLDGEPAQGVRVTARSQRSGLIAQNRFDFTDPLGNYIIQGITPDQDGVGVYAIEAQFLETPTQYLPGVYVTETATLVELTAGDTAEMDDFSLSPGVTISGTVTGPDGGVSGGEVVAFSSGQSVVTPVAGGSYTASGLRPGEVLLWAYGPGAATSYYPSSPVPDERISLPEDGDRAFGIDLFLPAESVLQAQLAGGPFEASSVLVYNTAQTQAISGDIDSTGAFAVGTLHPGDYLVLIDGVGDGLVEDFVRDADGEPQVFTVDGVTDIGVVQVPQAAVLEGTVVGRHSGEPIYGAAIIAEAQRTGERRSATTSRDGTYRIEGLFADRWQVRAEYQPPCEVDPSYVATYYPDQRNPTLGGVIELAPGDTVTWDTAIAPDVDRDGMDDVWEAENGLDPTRNDANEDLDGDGFSNRDEYLLGTNPNGGPEDTDVPGGDGCGCSSGPRLSWMWVFALVGVVVRRRAVA